MTTHPIGSTTATRTISPSFRLGLICGGPSPERGISLNSARSLLDHLGHEPIQIQPIYVDIHKQFYRISPAQLYSNTPADFDFKLEQTANQLSEQDSITLLKQCDLIFPIIHGAFGEDGTLQAWLEQHDLPFVGPDSTTCRAMFFKHLAMQRLQENNFTTQNNLLLSDETPDVMGLIDTFMCTHQLSRVVVKPIAGGSSIGVHSATNPRDAASCAQEIFQAKLCDQALVEPFCKGREFTIIVLQNARGEPVALIPSEIQISYENGQLFDYRRKYLPTTNTVWRCPPHFSDAIIARIQDQAEQIFRLFGCRDFARFDGWVTQDDTLMFTDLNPISGMEQNSFLFQQAAHIGLDHQAVLHNILSSACRRLNIHLPSLSSASVPIRQPVHVLLGGSTAERQVSVMSGSNVCLKLQHSRRYQPIAFFLDPNGDIWQLPLTLLLCHTAEEIHQECLTPSASQQRIERLMNCVVRRLFPHTTTTELSLPQPIHMTWHQFVQLSQQTSAFVFLALHGGAGEDGTLQAQLEAASLSYNGANAHSAALCMDKFATGEVITALDVPHISTVPKYRLHLTQLAGMTNDQYQTFWQQRVKELGTTRLVIKPQNDGCSAGIVVLQSSEELQHYAKLIQTNTPVISAHTFVNQPHEIELPVDRKTAFLLEAYIETDSLCLDNHNIKLAHKSGWLELTVGVWVNQGQYHVLEPSITVADHGLLSLEEKFQGGTGINITPPPVHLITAQQRVKLKASIARVAQALGIDHYARIDCFFHRQHNTTLIIEANSLPGLTPATVLYHQALCENPPLYPKDFLEKLIHLKEPAGVSPLAAKTLTDESPA